ncbi:hypothetical protein M1590_02685 [Candidatus Marsarchaeota archaeon]|nr:hypothetical protein [Candidatus Marsarchaeota archaeon]
MSHTKVFALPLFHEDNGEYLRIRRGIGQVAEGRSSVAYELPKNSLSEQLMNEVIGSSGRDLDTRIVQVLEEFHAPQPETALCDLIELDRAKHSGKITNVYPIDLDMSPQSLRSENQEYLKFMINMSQRSDQLNATILHAYPFKHVLIALRDIVAFEAKVFDLKEARIKSNVEHIINDDTEDRLLVMSGAIHIPNLEVMLKHDGIPVVELDQPSRVTGIWWTAYEAINAMRKAKESGISDLHSPELIRYALLLSLNVIKAVRFNKFNKGGGGSVSEDEAKAIRGISMFAEAETFYDRMQKFYRKDLLGSIVDLSRLHRED